MSEPTTRWTDAPPSDSDERRAAELISLTREIPPSPVELSSGWDGVLAVATKPRTSWRRLVLAGAIAALVGIVATSAVMKSRPREVIVATGTQWQRPREGLITLQQGRLETTRPITLQLVTPHLELVASACRFAAEVVVEGTRVTVLEGSAVVRASDGSEQTLHAGEAGRWPSQPKVAPALMASEPPALRPECSDVACLEAASTGDGLEAEVAFFELGRRQPARAVELWRTSLRRFPDGVFVPEVRLALMLALVRDHRYGEATSEAAEFERAFPDDPRVDDVRALHRQLEWLERER